MNISEELKALNIVEVKLIYDNPLNSEECIKDYKLEGKAKISFENNRLRLENELSEVLEQKANYVLWTDKIFDENIIITWKFYPIKEPGLAMMFFFSSSKRRQ